MLAPNETTHSVGQPALCSSFLSTDCPLAFIFPLNRSPFNFYVSPSISTGVFVRGPPFVRPRNRLPSALFVSGSMAAVCLDLRRASHSKYPGGRRASSGFLSMRVCTCKRYQGGLITGVHTQARSDAGVPTHVCPRQI